MEMRAAGIALGYAADRLLGDPARFHPVAGFGSCAAALESILYRDRRWAGTAYTALLVGSVAGTAIVADRVAHPAFRVILLGVATWAALGGTSLARVGNELAGHLEGGDLTRARELMPSLCGRDPALLDAEGLARAGVESVAENTADAAIGPMVYALMFGTPGVVCYRAINTLDSMVGYRSPRYRRFGWASARLDDAVNLLPARVSAVATVLSARAVDGDPRMAVRAWRDDAAAHPSPNAGVAEASAAGALGVQLGGLTQYRHGCERRPLLGSGDPPTAKDLRRAAKLSVRVQEGTAAAAVSAALAVAASKFILRRLRGS